MTSIQQVTTLFGVLVITLTTPVSVIDVFDILGFNIVDTEFQTT